MYDFVVVGVGPAGARFAERAASRGFDVVAFEQGEVGIPLACSGHVSRDIWEYTDSSVRTQLLQNEINGARFHVDDHGDDGYHFHNDEVVSNVIDRVELDRHLAKRAERNGATIRTGHTVTAVREYPDRIEVDVSTPSETTTVEGRMVVGCDGPRSRVRSALELPEPKITLHGVLGFSDEVDHDDFVDVHLTVPGFFSWRIPRGESGVEYGLATEPGAHVRSHFEDLLDAYDVSVSHRCSGMIPIGPPKSVSSHRGFLIGDAAAQTKPFTGGGILYGLQSADHAAKTVDPNEPASLQVYETRWRADLGREIRFGQWIRRMYSLPEPIQRIGLRLTAGEIGVHMDRPSTFFTKRHLGRTIRSKL